MTTRVETYDAVVSNDSDRLQAADEELTRLFPQRRVQRVLFVAPPDADATMFHYPTAKRRRYWNFAPYGIGAIASHLRLDGFQVDIVNLNHEVLKACHQSASDGDFDFDRAWRLPLAHKLSQFEPDIVGVTCMFTQTHKSLASVCNEIRLLSPSVPLAVGGVHVTNSFVNTNTSASLLRQLATVDLLFVYEAEVAFRQFVKVVNRQAPTATLAQVFFNSRAKKLYFPGRLIPNEQQLNVIPAHDLMDTAELSKYGQIGSFGCLKEEHTRFTTVLSNRGCRAQCTFCSVRNFNGVNVRTRSIQSVIDELLMLRHTYGIGHIMWLDDDFLYDAKRALTLFNEMVRQGVGITWDCTNGVIAAACTEELMAAAAASGCIGLNIGMESGNPQILRNVRKPGTVKNFLKAAEILRRYEEINARVFLMIGFPGETYRMILDTINVALEMNLDWYNVTLLQPLPNTSIFDSMVAAGLLKDIDFQEIRYNSGAYGKHRKAAETSRDLLSSDFKNAFQHVDLDAIPPKEQLDVIWAYMNYHLNFKRLFYEQRPVKLQQLLRYVGYIRDVVSPENAFAMYFYGYLQQRLSGRIEPETIRMLEDWLASSPYWQERFNDFGLSLEHLRTGEFPLSWEADQSGATRFAVGQHP